MAVGTHRWLIIACTLSLILVPLPASATHNSVGADAYIAQADEVDPDGTLTPDYTRNHSLAQTFHTNLDPAREQPPDQMGQRYRGCDKPADTKSEDGGYDPWDDPTDCYVGFMDAQMEYLILFSGTSRKLPDLLYPANPGPGDDFCNGKDTDDDGEPDHPGPQVGVDGIDQAIARANRSTSGQCLPFNNHGSMANDAGIDTDLLEAAFQAEQTPGAEDATGTPIASGTSTLPLLIHPYVFIFGEPVEGLDPGYTRPEAGEGVFGSNPLERGSALTDLDGACGDRTKECRLLTPGDLKHYDAQDEDGFEKGRLCEFAPQLENFEGSAPTGGPCGAFGRSVGAYQGPAPQGGLGSDAVPNTWVNQLPGWYHWFVHTAVSWLDPVVWGLQAPGEDPELKPGTYFYYAINPDVPSAESPVWCMQPSMLAEGTGEGNPDVNKTVDPGVYGAYQADAIDADLYTHWAHNPAQTAVDASNDEVQALLDIADDAFDNASSVVATADAIIENNTPKQVPGQPTLEQLLDDAFQAGADGLDRADYTESDAPEPDTRLNQTDWDFTRVFDETQLSCNNGLVQLTEKGATQWGGVQFNANILRDAGFFIDAEFKDPTLLENGLPARESDTKQGYWTPSLYTFVGSMVGKLDSNHDEAFDGCTPRDGQPHPDRDRCPWQPTWDAYRGNRNTSLEQKGYDVHGNDSDEDSGVGMWFVLNVSGPIVVANNHASFQRQVDQAPGLTVIDRLGQHCIVGTSKGFAKYLADNLDNDGAGPDVRNDTEAGAFLKDKLCGSADGAKLVFTNAFFNSGGNSFESAIEWGKLTPTPKPAQNLNLGAGDELCVNAQWAVRDSFEGNTTDTDGHVDLNATNDPLTLEDCDSFTTGTK